MLSSRRNWSKGIRQAPARLLARLGVRPNHVTVASFLLACVAAFLLAKQRWILGGALAILASSLDFVDGELARLTNRVTPQGGYLDSLLDRFVDFVLLLGVMVALDDKATWVVGSIAVFGSMVTSYAKARAYEDKPIAKDAWKNSLVERPERYFLLMPALIAQGVLVRQDVWLTTADDPRLMLWVLALLAATSLLTILQRMATAWRVLGQKE